MTHFLNCFQDFSGKSEIKLQMGRTGSEDLFCIFLIFGPFSWILPALLENYPPESLFEESTEKDIRNLEAKISENFNWFLSCFFFSKTTLPTLSSRIQEFNPNKGFKKSSLHQLNCLILCKNSCVWEQLNS